MTRWLVCLLAVMAGPALSLSCLPADVAYSFTEASAERDPPVVVHGTLSFDSADMPLSDLSGDTPETTRVPARLEGMSLNQSGFETEFSRDVTLELACFGPWCGQAENGQTYLAFLKTEGSDHVLVVDPCYTWHFAEPSDAQLAQAIACMQGTCVPGTQ